MKGEESERERNHEGLWSRGSELKFSQGRRMERGNSQPGNGFEEACAVMRTECYMQQMNC